MEISNSVIPRSQTPGCFTGGGIDIIRRRGRQLAISEENRIIPTEFRCRVSNSSGTGRLVRRDIGGCFKEKGHIEYYRISPVCGEKKEKQAAGKRWGQMSINKRTKLLKGLADDLSMFSDLGFGLDPDETKGKVFSQAAEVLLAQLEHLKSEDKKQSKSQKKMNMMMEAESSSSSSSSESSDSECEGETVNMSDLKTSRSVQRQRQLQLQPALEVETLEPRSDQETVLNSSNPITVTEPPCQARMFGPPRAMEEVGDVSTSNLGNLNGLILKGVTTTPEVELERIQVSMGKKLGAQALADEFDSVLGRKGSVVTCKCMGKCKSAPNVKVLYGKDDDEMDSVRNPLCLAAVGLEDVDSIVANYFGKEALFDSCAPASTLASSS